MKYFVLLGDGMADWPLEDYASRTPLQLAVKPMMDELCAHSLCGMVMTVPEGMVPESDTANLGVLGYDPRVYSKGRSPLEAASIGLDMQPDDVAFRCNLLTISEEERDYEKKRMIDHGADEITTEEADQLIRALQEKLGTDKRRFYTGVSYRHCMLWKNPPKIPDFSRPHDILGLCVGDYLPESKEYLDLQKASYEILVDHPVNLERKKQGLHPANSAWFWSPGKKPQLPNFNERFHVRGTVIAAVDLIRGIAKVAGLDAPFVRGATGTFDTNYDAKSYAAITAFMNGSDFVYLHVEAPDECGHRAEADHKIMSIEFLDQLILKPVKEYLDGCGDDYRILVLPDHPTPIAKRTHTREAVPFFIYDSREKDRVSGITCYSEKDVKAGSDLYLEEGTELMPLFLQ